MGVQVNNQSEAILESVSVKQNPSQLIPGVYDKFQSELLNMLESLESGEEYKSPFFSRGVDPYSAGFSIVQNMTFSTFDQIINHLYKSLEVEKKWADMLANLF